MEDEPDPEQLLGMPDEARSGPSTARSARSWPGLATWVIGPIVFIAIIIIAATSLPSAISAAMGHGTRGTFTAVTYDNSGKSGYWSGTFQPANNGPAVTDVAFNGLSGVQPGSVVPALMNGGEVYAAHGSKEWLVDAFLLLVAVLFFINWCARIPLRHVRQPGSVRPPPWSRTT